MPENLYVRFSRVAESLDCCAVQWLLLDESTGIVRAKGTGDGSDFQDELNNLQPIAGEVHVLLSTELCLLTRATVPGRQQRQVSQAIPYMVEDDLATEVEHCHFATSSIGGSEYAVAVVDSELMSDLFDWLTTTGLPIFTLTPDVLHQPSWPSALVHGGRCWVRTEDNGGVLTSVALLPMLFGSPDVHEMTTVGETVDNEARPVSITASKSDVDTIEVLASQLAAESLAVETHSTEYSAFEYLCRNFNTNAINFLQGDYKIKRPPSTRGVRWQTLAVLAACTFVFNILLLFVQGTYLDIKASQHEAEAVDLYRSVFPNARSVTGIGTKWEAHLRGNRVDSGQSFMKVFSEAARHVPASDMQLISVNFNASRGDLIMQLQASRNEQFVTLARTLSQAGLQADIGTLSQDEGLVKGNIKIRVDG